MASPMEIFEKLGLKKKPALPMTEDGMAKSHTEETTKKAFKKAKEDFGAFKAAQVVKQKGNEIEKNLSE